MADIDKDGAKEIVVAQSGGYLTVYRLDKTVKWQVRPTTSELRGLLVADLDGNNSTLEVVVTAAIGSKTNTWVYNSNGTLRSGWPQMSSNNGYAWGVYNANAAAANLDPSDPALELVVPSDVHYIIAYKPNGASLAANTTVYPSRAYWGLVGVWENLAVEKRGWGECTAGYPRSENYRPNFAGSPATIADLNGDGQREVVVTGNVYDCSQDPYLDRYIGPFIFNKDRTRFNSGGYRLAQHAGRHRRPAQRRLQPDRKRAAQPGGGRPGRRRQDGDPVCLLRWARCTPSGWTRPSTAPGRFPSTSPPRVFTASPRNRWWPTWTTTARPR